jgi:beta-1,4-mannosyl-glycoprotein beta-1,4-N-acetylglucosaminyltransferase
MKIFDCTTYFEEDLMMDLRFNILNDFVDKFVVSEATFTHSGNDKKIKFNPNNFKKFKDKIIHIIVDKDPVNQIQKKTNDSGLKRLNSIMRIEFQRNEIIRGLKEASDEDYIIYSDNDEIPDLEKINFSQNKSKIILFKQNLYYYKFNLAYPKLDWYGSKSCKKKDLINFSWLRNIKTKRYNFLRLDTFFSDTKYIDLRIVENGGWHFTNLKTPEELYRKYLNDEMHSEFENKKMNINEIKKKINNRYVNYNHFADSRSSIEQKYENQFSLEKVNLDKLPNYIQFNKDKYKEWIDV